MKVWWRYDKGLITVWWRYDRGLMMVWLRFDKGLIKVGWRFDEGTIEVWLRFDEGTIDVWWRYDEGLIKFWWRYDYGFIKVWLQFDEGTIKVWWRFDAVQRFVQSKPYVGMGLSAGMLSERGRIMGFLEHESSWTSSAQRGFQGVLYTLMPMEHDRRDASLQRRDRCATKDRTERD